MPTKQRFKVGLVQMAMSTSPEDNVGKAAAKVREAAGLGAEVVCLPEMYRTPYFCQKEDHANFALAETVPGPSTEALGRAAQGARASPWSSPIFERRAAGRLPQQRGRPRRRRRRSPASTARCTSPTTRSSTRSSTSPRATWASGPSTSGRAGSARSSAGTSGTRRARGSPRSGAPPSSSTRPRSAGTRARRPSTASSQRSAWQTIQRSHAIANGVYVAVVNRVGHEVPAEGGDGLEFWGSSFLADPFGVVIAEASTDREEILVGEVQPRRASRRCARTGRSSATGGSTPTPGSTGASSTGSSRGCLPASPHPAPPCFSRSQLTPPRSPAVSAAVTRAPPPPSS